MTTDPRGAEDPVPPDPASFFHHLAGALGDYARAEKDRLTLEASVRAGELAAGLVVVLVVALAAGTALLLLAAAWGLFLGRILDDVALGFVLSAATMALLVLLFLLLWRLGLRDRTVLAVVNAIHGRC